MKLSCYFKHCFIACLALTVCATGSTESYGQSLSNRDLRNIDELANALIGYTEELHDEYHHHFERVRHAEKLDADVSHLEKIAKELHEFAHDAPSTEATMKRLRADANELLQLSWQIERTVMLTESWVRTSDERRGIAHMRDVSRDVVRTVFRIDDYLPVDTDVIDGQLARLENAVKALHDEFHEHLEGYEVSRHLDEDLESLEKSVEHMHDLAHDKHWNEIDLLHITHDIRDVFAATQHIEELFIRQARIGVRTRDFVGIEHSRDAISDVLASIRLLEHMIEKTDPRDHTTLHRHITSGIHDRYRTYRVDPHNDDRHHYDPERYRYGYDSHRARYPRH